MQVSTLLTSHSGLEICDVGTTPMLQKPSGGDAELSMGQAWNLVLLNLEAFPIKD